MPSFTDQVGNTITLASSPTRIISLVPSQTELLSDLGLDDRVAGITKFCVRPPDWHRRKTRVGGTRKLNMQLIHQLQPDLVIANKEENTQEEITSLADHFPVWTSDISNLARACDMIHQVGNMTSTTTQSSAIIRSIHREFDNLQHGIALHDRIRAAYLIWNDPLMTIGGDTFIHAMLSAAGFTNVFAGKNRYPVTSIDEILQLDAQVLFLSSEPYPFRQKHIDQLQPLLPSVKIQVVDGEMFSWYGSRLRYAPAYFREVRDGYRMPDAE